MTKDTMIELKNISKSYKLQKGEIFFGLKKVNLKVARGQNIGIIGNNGAGKTTLLKIIAGVIRPTSGKRTVRGRMVALMNLEDGFNLELSGRENILLNGLLVGMTKKEIEDNMEEIINFSGIGSYIDEPFFKYSMGMKFRLAFSVAVASQCDIMLIDEMFFVGDFDFQRKVFETLKTLQRKKNKMTTIMCSQMPEFIHGFSNDYYLIEKGKMKSLNKESLVEMIRNRNRVWNKVFKLKKYISIVP